MIRKIILSCCFISLICFVFSDQKLLLAKTEANSGLSEVKKAYVTEEQYYLQTIASGKQYHLKCATTCEVFNDQTQKYELVTTTEDVFASEHARHTISDDIEVYMDERDVFSINKRTNVLVHTLSALNKADLSEALIFKKASQDSLLLKCSVVNAGIETLNGKQLIHFQLLPKTTKLPYTSISFYIEPQTYVFRKMCFELNPANSRQIKNYTINILERGSTATDPKLANLHDRFLNASGSLKAPYNKYHLEDLSKGKKSREMAIKK